MSATHCRLCGYLHEYCECVFCHRCNYYCDSCNCCDFCDSLEDDCECDFCKKCYCRLEENEVCDCEDEDDDLEDGEYELIGFIKIPRDTFSFDWEKK